MKSEKEIKQEVLKEIISLLDEEPYDVLYNTHMLRKYIRKELQDNGTTN